jgi:methyltransferase
MRLAYPGAFAAMFAEGMWRGGAGGMLPAAGIALFVAAKALKWWAMASLGPAWTFRVIVVPGAPLVGAGPYRVMRHPNYVAVLGELIGAGLLTRSAIAGPLSILIFAPLLWKRIAVEESALRPPSRAAGRHR